jgi:hypothetical protein
MRALMLPVGEVRQRARSRPRLAVARRSTACAKWAASGLTERAAAGDCLARAVTIVAGRPYSEVHAAMTGLRQQTTGVSSEQRFEAARQRDLDLQRRLGELAVEYLAKGEAGSAAFMRETASDLDGTSGTVSGPTLPPSASTTTRRDSRPTTTCRQTSRLHAGWPRTSAKWSCWTTPSRSTTRGSTVAATS